MAHPHHPDPYRWHAIALATLFVVTIPAIVAATIVFRPEPPPPPVNPWLAAAEALGVAPHALERGSAIFARSCAACHAADGAGIPRLGKPLRNSEFVQTRSDRELIAMVTDGRLPADPANTTGVPMPARGAQGLQDGEIHDVVVYLRTLQDPDSPLASLDNWMTKPAAPSRPESSAAPASAQTASARTINGSEDLLADASGGSVVVDDASVTREAMPVATAPSVSRTTFVASCSACHGEDGEGVEGLGKALDTSAFVRSKSDKELTTFIKTGRPIWDAENTTGLDMPPKGGNPALTDDDLANIVSYIRVLQD